MIALVSKGRHEGPGIRAVEAHPASIPNRTFYIYPGQASISRKNGT
jgi:hypothetical protein